MDVSGIEYHQVIGLEFERLAVALERASALFDEANHIVRVSVGDKGLTEMAVGTALSYSRYCRNETVGLWRV